MNTKTHSPSTIFSFTLFFTTVLGTCSRIVFFYLTQGSMSPGSFLFAFGRGLFFDGAVALYVFLPFGVLGLLPVVIWQTKWMQRTVFLLFYFSTAVLAFASFAEIFFIKEFNSRFNFIAVDYLVYTNEVIRNIWESYPVAWIIPVFLLVHLFLVRSLSSLFAIHRVPPFERLKSFTAIAGAILCMLFFFESKALEGADSIEADVAKNPLHALFAAYRNNEIDFERFYTKMERNRAAHLVHESFEADTPGLAVDESHKEDELSIVRNIMKRGPEKKLNIVVVLMESMSARFLKSFGAEENLTPNLDRLAERGLFFDKVYSTGTRTVRGIEAVVLSMPPTPGQSIVRRPGADKVFNIGTVLRSKGYQTQFVYGGRSFFDNMGNFFASNGFDVRDQGDMSKSEIHFSNAWGVCDEDLFNFAIKNADQISSKPFFQLILTTSNHRPYTYPEGRINTSVHGRHEAVMYSDYAIGKYIREASKKNWFNDTIFIFVADHNASVAGGEKILPYDYRIPLIFYSPKHIKPLRSSILGSQVDLAPTLFGLLNFSYQSRFFGHDLLHSHTERAFLATYQTVGLLTKDKMVLLSPNRNVTVYRIEDERPTLVSEFKGRVGQKFTDPDVDETVGFYEAASDWSTRKLLKEAKVTSGDINPRY